MGDRSRYGLLVSALGAVLLAVAVFLPWYGLSFTAAGATAAGHASEQLAQQYGNSALQSAVASTQAHLAGIAGHEFIALSAHQVLHELNVLLLVLAGLALLDALAPLARTGSTIPDGAGRAVVVLGLLAAVCVIYRMVHTPLAVEGLLAVKLREGAWLALFGALTMALGGVWPRSSMLRVAVDGETVGANPFEALSGWTPGPEASPGLPPSR